MTQPPTITNLTDKFAALIEALRGGRSADVVTALVDELATDIIAELMASPFKDELAGAFGIELQEKLRNEVGPGLAQIKEAVNLKGDATVNAVNTKGDATVNAINTKGDATVNAVNFWGQEINSSFGPVQGEVYNVALEVIATRTALATGQQTIATALTAITALLRQIERCACQSATLLLGAPWNAATSSGSACENAASDPVTLSYDYRLVPASSWTPIGETATNESVVRNNGWANGLGVQAGQAGSTESRILLQGPRWFRVGLFRSTSAASNGEWTGMGMRSSLPDARISTAAAGLPFIHSFFVPASAWIEIYANGIAGLGDPADLTAYVEVADCTPVEPPPVWTPTNRCTAGGDTFEETITFDPAGWMLYNSYAGRDFYFHIETLISSFLSSTEDGEFIVLEPLSSVRYCISMDYEGETSVSLEHAIEESFGGIGLPGGTDLLTYKGQTSRTFDRQNAPPTYTLGHRLWLSVETGTPLPTVYVYMSGRLAV